MLLEFEWVGVGALVSVYGMQAKEHCLKFRLDFHIHHLHHLHLLQTLGEGGKTYIFRQRGANGTALGCLQPFALRKGNLVGLHLKYGP